MLSFFLAFISVEKFDFGVLVGLSHYIELLRYHQRELLDIKLDFTCYSYHLVLVILLFNMLTVLFLMKEINVHIYFCLTPSIYLKLFIVVNFLLPFIILPLSGVPSHRVE